MIFVAGKCLRGQYSCSVIAENRESHLLYIQYYTCDYRLFKKINSCIILHNLYACIYIYIYIYIYIIYYIYHLRLHTYIIY